jgi:geranylgeranyl pyrophosphate synthase
MSIELHMLTGTAIEDRLEAGRLEINIKLQEIIEQAIAKGQGEVAKLAGEVLLAGGKRLRPLLLLLAYEVAGGSDRDQVIPLALAFELIHTATLVHDDINDNAKQRRGVSTLHERAGSEKAMIAGDWLFVQGFAQGGGYDSTIVEIIAECCSGIASSELKQLSHVNDLATTPEDYYSIVQGKTARPFEAGCQAAALVAGLNSEKARKFGEFGRELGLAFQIVDDLLDILGDERMGKPRGADVIEGKMTLPLIHALTLLHGDSRTRLSEVIVGFHDGLWDELVELLKEAGSLEYARTLVRNHIDRALHMLRQFPESEARNCIESLTQIVMDRYE